MVTKNNSTQLLTQRLKTLPQGGRNQQKLFQCYFFSCKKNTSNLSQQNKVATSASITIRVGSFKTEMVDTPFFSHRLTHGSAKAPPNLLFKDLQWNISARPQWSRDMDTIAPDTWPTFSLALLTLMNYLGE